MILTANGLITQHLYVRNPPNTYYTNQNRYNIWIISPKKILSLQIPLIVMKKTPFD